MQLIDLKGQRFGKLLVIKRVGSNHNKKVIWECLCDCGRTIILTTNMIRQHKTKSCGCSRMRQNSYMWKGCGDISGTYWVSIKISAEKRNKEFTIDKEYVWDLFLKQCGKCAITGVDIFFESIHSKERTASLDRKDSSKGYIPGNIQWVHKVINYMKMDIDEQEFINWCQLVVDNNKND